MATAKQQLTEVSMLLKSKFPGKRFSVAAGGPIWPVKDPNVVVINHDAYMTDDEVAEMHQAFNGMDKPPLYALARMEF